MKDHKAFRAEQANWTRQQWDEQFARIAARGPELRAYWPPENYEAYLASDLWRRIRARVMKRDGHACVRCAGGADLVHLRRYTKAVLDGEDDSQLVSLCDDCHRTVHYEASGRVRNSWNEADAILMESPSVTPITPQSALDSYYKASRQKPA